MTGTPITVTQADRELRDAIEAAIVKRCAAIIRGNSRPEIGSVLTEYANAAFAAVAAHRTTHAPSQPAGDDYEPYRAALQASYDIDGWKVSTPLSDFDKTRIRACLAFVKAMPAASQLVGDDIKPTHYCVVCAAIWQKWSDGTWTLRSDDCGPCCNNAPMGDQILPINADGSVDGEAHRKATAMIQSAFRKGSNKPWQASKDAYAAAMPAASQPIEYGREHTDGSRSGGQPPNQHSELADRLQAEVDKQNLDYDSVIDLNVVEEAVAALRQSPDTARRDANEYGGKSSELAKKLRSFAIGVDMCADKQIMIYGSWITAQELFAASDAIASKND